MIQPISYHMRLKRSLPNPTPPHPTPLKKSVQNLLGRGNPTLHFTPDAITIQEIEGEKS
jgi:hypothetical protein